MLVPHVQLINYLLWVFIHCVRYIGHHGLLFKVVFSFLDKPIKNMRYWLIPGDILSNIPHSFSLLWLTLMRKEWTCFNK